MTIPALHFEAKKHSYRQTQDGVVISFVMNPVDVNPHLAAAALGTRFMVALAEIGDDEQPIPSPGASVPSQTGSVDSGSPPPQAPGEQTKGGWYGLKPSARAALLCKDPDFLRWANETWRLEMVQEEVAEWLRNRVDVYSRAYLDPSNEKHGPDALKRYMRLEGQYRIARGLETQEVGS